MKKPEHKYWLISPHDIGRELGNIDYIIWAEERLAEFEKYTRSVINHYYCLGTIDERNKIDINEALRKLNLLIKEEK
jgi:hypothetical protein